MVDTLYGLTKQEWDNLVEYDPFDGGLIWKERPESMFKSPNRQKAWNKRYANKAAGGWNTWKGKTYRKLRWGGKKLRVCRIVYFIETGIAADLVDHIDGDSTNDVISNLRNVDIQTNNENKVKAMVTNTSGYLGVSALGDGAFDANITTKGKRIYLGNFDCPVRAHEAYVQAKRNYHKGCTI